MNDTSVTYIANAGVLINLGEKKVLIDGLCNSKLPTYRNTPSQLYNQIIQGIPPYDNIDLMLITHHHGDHFDANMVSEFLESHDDIVVVSTDHVITELRRKISNPLDHRLIAVTPQLYSAERITVKGIDIQVISMTHDGKEFANVKNLAFLIESGRTILHVGDAAPIADNYHVLWKNKIDLLIANFPYVALPGARQIVKDYIDPQQIAVVHLPIIEQDRFGWVHSTKKIHDRIKDCFYPTEFMEHVGFTMTCY